MKKFLVVMMGMLIFGVGLAQATTFSDSGIKVWGEQVTGRIHVSGSSADIEKYVKNIQFCPDQIKYRKDFVCGLNWPIAVEKVSAEEAVFQLDTAAMKNGQRAFNFKDPIKWSQVSSGKAGQNIVVEMSDPNADSEDGRAGCHYTYIGDLPAGSYTPYKPELCGGGHIATAKAVAIHTASPAKAEMSQSMINSPDAQTNQSKQEAKVVVKIKGNNNSVVTKIKQQKNITQQRGSTVKIKGNNNTVKACTVNINITNQVMGGHAVAPGDCAGCHNADVWPHLREKYGAFGNCTTSEMKKQINTNKKEGAKKTFLDGTPRN